MRRVRALPRAHEPFPPYAPHALAPPPSQPHQVASFWLSGGAAPRWRSARGGAWPPGWGVANGLPAHTRAGSFPRAQSRTLLPAGASLPPRKARHIVLVSLRCDRSPPLTRARCVLPLPLTHLHSTPLPPAMPLPRPLPPSLLPLSPAFAQASPCLPDSSGAPTSIFPVSIIRRRTFLSRSCRLRVRGTHGADKGGPNTIPDHSHTP